MATEEKKVSKLDSILNKIDAFFEGLMSAKKSDDLEEDDDMESKADDMEEKKSKKSKEEDDKDEDKKSAKSKTKKATDDEDSQDPDDDGDNDEDGEDDDDDKDAKKAAAIIASKDKIIAKQNALLKAAQEALAERDEEVRETIKSTFKPQGSQRTTKVATKNELPSWAKPTTELGKKAVQMTTPKRK